MMLETQNKSMRRLFFLISIFLGAVFLVQNTLADACPNGGVCVTDGTGCPSTFPVPSSTLCTFAGVSGSCCMPLVSTPPCASPNSCVVGSICPGNFASGTCDSGSVCCAPNNPGGGGGSGTGGGGGGGTGGGGGGNEVFCPGYWRAGICFPATTGLSNAPVAVILMNFMWWLLAVLGFIGIIAFVISGMQYLLSAGSEEMVKTAKNSMKYSIIGMVVALSGLVIIYFIDEMLSGSLILYFNIGF